MTPTPNTEEKGKKTLPPYLSLAKLQKLIEVISRTNFKVVNATVLKSDFGATDASIAVGTLRFLNLINDQGVPTENIKKFHLTGGERAAAIQPIVKEAYSELFAATVDGKPEELAQDRLENLFVTNYNVVPRIATPASRAFLFLCGEAGLKEKQVRAPRVVNPDGQKRTPKKAPPAAKSGQEEPNHTQYSGTSTTVPFASGSIKLTIPLDVLTNLELLDEYKKVIGALTAFGEQYLAKKVKDEPAGE